MNESNKDKTGYHLFASDYHNIVYLIITWHV